MYVLQLSVTVLFLLTIALNTTALVENKKYYEFDQISVLKKPMKHTSSMIIGNRTQNHVDVIVSNKINNSEIKYLLTSAELLSNTSVPSPLGIGCQIYNEAVTITSWTTGRYNDYTCMGQIFDGEYQWSQQYCEGMEISASANIAEIKELLGLSLGFGYSTEKCTSNAYTCIQKDRLWSKLYARAQRQAAKGYYTYTRNCNNAVDDYKVDWTGTVTWGNYYECHYESFSDSHCLDGTG